MENHTFWSPDFHFQWCLYGGNYMEIFRGLTTELARWTRLKFYHPGYARPSFVIMRSFDCWEPRPSKRYRVDMGFHNISGSMIFKLFKSRWVPGCTASGRSPWEFANRQVGDTDATMYLTANFPGNWCSQPRILRPFGRSVQELLAEYQVETIFINFSVSKAKKGGRLGPGSGNSWKSHFKATISQQK
jgi:hypothetical protein